MRVTRRQVVRGVGAVGLGLVAGCAPWPLSHPARPLRIGYLSLEDPNHPLTTLDQSFQDALGDLGYVEGQNVAIEWRYMAGRPERSPAMVGELVRAPVDLLVASGNPMGKDAVLATDTIPIVLPMIADPVRAGTVEQFNRPGRNVTGISLMAPEMHVKRLELLKDTVPTIGRLAVVRQVGEPANESVWQALTPAAQVLGVELLWLDISSPEEFARVAETAIAQRVEALMVSTGAVVTGSLAPQIVEFTLRHRLPSVYPGRGAIRLGGLMLYGPNTNDMHRRAAYFVDRIVKGTKPADLPVEQPSTFDFVINLQTAQALGLTIPQSVLLQATEVIQ